MSDVTTALSQICWKAMPKCRDSLQRHIRTKNWRLNPILRNESAVSTPLTSLRMHLKHWSLSHQHLVSTYRHLELLGGINGLKKIGQPYNSLRILHVHFSPRNPYPMCGIKCTRRSWWMQVQLVLKRWIWGPATSWHRCTRRTITSRRCLEKPLTIWKLRIRIT